MRFGMARQGFWSWLFHLLALSPLGKLIDAFWVLMMLTRNINVYFKDWWRFNNNICGLYKL